MSDVTLLRVGILIAGLILIGAIIFFGRPRKAGQGRRVLREVPGDGARLDPVVDPVSDAAPGDDSTPEAPLAQAELELAPTNEAPAAGSELGKRSDETFDKIVTLYLAARAAPCCTAPISSWPPKRPA